MHDVDLEVPHIDDPVELLKAMIAKCGPELIIMLLNDALGPSGPYRNGSAALGDYLPTASATYMNAAGSSVKISIAVEEFHIIPECCSPKETMQ